MARRRKERQMTSGVKSSGALLKTLMQLHISLKQHPVPHLNREDLYSHIFTEKLSFPHAPEAPPGFYLDQLQRFVTQQRGWG